MLQLGTTLEGQRRQRCERGGVKIQQPPTCLRTDMALAHSIYVCSPSASRCLPGSGCSIRRVSHLVPSKCSRLSFPCCHAGELAQLAQLTKENYRMLTGLYPWYHWHPAAIVQASKGVRPGAVDRHHASLSLSPSLLIQALPQPHHSLTTFPVECDNRCMITHRADPFPPSRFGQLARPLADCLSERTGSLVLLFFMRCAALADRCQLAAFGNHPDERPFPAERGKGGPRPPGWKAQPCKNNIFPKPGPGTY
ncbi:hypothetical protein N431DRAFT_150012 [Stipitochalara longipes BDJ]|nr:hypothetical protein N431DRAFT_150012 [Stipitochalara longipes BDJ]